MTKKLKELRESKNWSISELAEKAKVPVKIIQQLEEPDSEVKIGKEIDSKYVACLASLLDIPAAQIFPVKETDKKPEPPRFYIDTI